jgi:hypothetical protein
VTEGHITDEITMQLTCSTLHGRRRDTGGRIVEH